MSPSPSEHLNPLDVDEIETRVQVALARFIFPGKIVPRFEMAAAVSAALTHGDDYRDYLPAKRTIRFYGTENATRRTQWRIMVGKSFTGDELGAAWRDKAPTDEELSEWCDDFQPLALRVETRTVTVTEPEVDDAFGMYFLEQNRLREPKA